MVLAKCKCISKFQDEHYGIGIRAYNIVNKQSTSVQKVGRCTVCGEERHVNIVGDVQQQVATEEGKEERKGKKEKTSKHDKHGKHSGREGREKKSKSLSL
jgi:hypothetical protein